MNNNDTQVDSQPAPHARGNTGAALVAALAASAIAAVAGLAIGHLTSWGYMVFFSDPSDGWAELSALVCGILLAAGSALLAYVVSVGKLMRRWALGAPWWVALTRAVAVPFFAYLGLRVLYWF